MNCRKFFDNAGNICDELGAPNILIETGDEEFKSHQKTIVQIDAKTKKYLDSFAGDIEVNWKTLGLNLDGSVIVISLEEDEDGDAFIVIKNMNLIYLSPTNSEFGFIANIFPKKRKIFIDSFYLSNFGKGLGTKLMASFIQECSKLKSKIDAIEVIAIRRTPYDEKTRSKLLGYYFFPRIGFDASLDDVYKPENIFAWKSYGERRPTSKATRLVDYVYEDLDWWKEHGVPARCSFDLSENSKSWKIFREYIRSKQKSDS